jgi:hypothetical protein
MAGIFSAIFLENHLVLSQFKIDGVYPLHDRPVTQVTLLLDEHSSP